MKHASRGYCYCAFLIITFFASVSGVCERPEIETPIGATYDLDSKLYTDLNAYQCGCYNQNSNKSYVCVRKCCEKNYILDKGECVPDVNGSFSSYMVPTINLFSEDFFEEKPLNEFRVVSGMVKCVGNKSVQLSTYQAGSIFDDAMVITQNEGYLWDVDNNWMYTFDHYCIEYSEDEDVLAYFCEQEFVEDLNFGDRLSFIGTMISLPFLLITFVVYLLLPKRTLHGTCLLCYVFVLFVAYFLLDFSQLYTGEMTFTGCRIMGMTTLYSLLSSICWMNCMSYDIYSTFRDPRGCSVNSKSKFKKRFLFFSLYSWGIPLLMIGLVMLLSSVSKPHVWYDPGVRGEECFLRDGIPELLYFYGPLAILITANIVMFIITALRVRKMHKDTEMLTKKGSQKHSDGDDKYRFGLYIKLLFAMGINWFAEIITWALLWKVKNLPPAVCYVTDFGNALYGVVIFFVFVFKKSIWKQLKKRYYMWKGDSSSERTETTSNGAQGKQ